MSENQEKQQRIEENQYMKGFIETLGVDYSIDRPPQDPPDFILERSGEIYSVEMTEFFWRRSDNKAFPRQQVEKSWEDLSGKIEEKRKPFQELHQLSVVLFFKELKTPREQDAFVDELISFVRVQSEHDPETEYFPETSNIDYPLLKKYLNKVFIQPCNVYVSWNWNHNVSSVGVNEEDLEAIVRKKTRKFKPYSNSKENWLLIVSGYRLSQEMGLQTKETFNSFHGLQQDLIRSPFQKVYIYQEWHKHIFLWENREGWKQIA